MVFLDDNTIKIGAVILPGLYRKMTVSKNALVEEQEVKGSSVKPKQAVGYEDAKIKIEIIVLDGPVLTKEEKLLTIRKIFQLPGQAKPVIYPLVSTLSAIMGIEQVICNSIEVDESNKKDEMIVSLEFLEYVPMIITARKASAGKNSVGGKTGGTDQLNADYKNYLSDDRGGAPKSKNKTSRTPAVDQALTLQKDRY